MDEEAILLVLPSVQTPHQVYLSFQDVDLRSNDQVLLSGITGAIEPGSMLTILGSGEGPAWLIDILRGYQEAALEVGLSIEGMVTWNGFAPDSGAATASFVQGVDILPDCLTPKELLFYTATTRLPQLNLISHLQMVDELLRISNLVSEQDIYLRSLNGGQRRRLQIVRDLIGCSGLVFLHEPTSGLDVEASVSVLLMLEELRNRKYSVVCTLVSGGSGVWSHLDILLVLSACGRPIYHGPAKTAEIFFASQNFSSPRDFALIDYIVNHLCKISDGETVDAMVKNACKTLEAKHRHQLASSIVLRSAALPPMPINNFEIGIVNTYEKSVLFHLIGCEVAMLAGEGSVVYRTLLAPAMFGAIFGFIFESSSMRPSFVSERCGCYFLLLTYFTLDSFRILLPGRRRIFWTDVASKKVWTLGHSVAVGVSELILRRFLRAAVIASALYVPAKMPTDFSTFATFVLILSFAASAAAAVSTAVLLAQQRHSPHLVSAGAFLKQSGRNDEMRTQTSQFIHHYSVHVNAQSYITTAAWMTAILFSLSGYPVPLSKYVLPFAAVSPFYHAFRALAVNELANRRLPMVDERGFLLTVDSNELLKLHGLPMSGTYFYLTAMVLLTAAILLIGFSYGNGKLAVIPLFANTCRDLWRRVKFEIEKWASGDTERAPAYQYTPV